MGTNPIGALKAASHIDNPLALAAFLAVLIVFGWLGLPRVKNTKMRWAALAAVVLLALAALLVYVLPLLQKVYRIHVMVLDQESQPVPDVVVTCNYGEVSTEGTGRYEIDVSPQSKPSDGRITIYAREKNANLAGSADLILKGDWTPRAFVRLIPAPEVEVRGRVVDTDGRSVKGVRISVDGYPVGTVTDESGNFELAAHTSNGQFVTVHAEKGSLAVRTMVVAGSTNQIVLR